MEFKQMKPIMKKFFEMKAENATHLFEVNIDKDVFWNLYLDSFPDGANKLFRKRSVHDCSCCRSFIRNFGNVVFIKDNVVTSIWDFKTNDVVFQSVFDVMSAYIKARPVTDVYITKEKKIGTDHNLEKVPANDEGQIITWDHFNLVLPDKFVSSRDGSSIGELRGFWKATHDVFKGSLEKITEDSLLTVLELIHQNTLYRGPEWEYMLQEFLKYKKAYSVLETDAEKENFVWEKCVIVGGAVGKIKNNSIGTLLIDISEDMDLDQAVRAYEKIVAGHNYKRPKPIYTERMLQDAKKDIEQEGYLESLDRRYGKLDDISINNILFVNRDSATRLVGNTNVFDEMSQNISINPKKFSRVEEIGIADFIKNVLPTTKEVEVLFDTKLSTNTVSLIAPKNRDSKTMFKWDNNFSWAYTGNITDSDMRENVKAAGGNVDGVLRFSIQWNDVESDLNDLDAHCIEPDTNHIFYPNKAQRHPSSAMLDVDIRNPETGKPAVENIAWIDKNRMREGVYTMAVHCFANHGGRSGFRAEIEFDGQIHTFDYNKPMRHDETVMVANISFSKVNGFTIKEMLPSNVSSREVWGLKTNQFVPVSIVMYSPNYWNEQEGIGHRHYFFMLKDCINPESPNGFYNEFLKENLLKHKRFFEALGSKMAVAPDNDQLSGIGFSSSRRNELIVKVIGQTERILKIKF